MAQGGYFFLVRGKGRSVSRLTAAGEARRGKGRGKNSRALLTLCNQGLSTQTLSANTASRLYTLR